MHPVSRKVKNAFLFLACLFSTTSFAFAHEVYVLNTETVARDIAVVSPNPFSVILNDEYQFLLWGFICALAVVFILFFSLTKNIERFADPFLFRIKKYAPLVARLTFGVCLIASAYNGALFGPELPLSVLVGGYAPLLGLLIYVLGISLLLGIFVRFCSLVVLVVFSLSVMHYGIYMLTYANYLGEILINLLLGGGAFSLGQKLFSRKNYFNSFFVPLEKYAFFILRVLFGTAVIFASVYAKFMHSQLALDVVIQYHLTNYFHFEPLFIVLGALIIEFLIGMFFIFGFEVRFTALVFLAFLALSLSYFGEAVWPHIVLIGVNIALLTHGYDSFTVETLLQREKKLEAVF